MPTAASRVEDLQFAGILPGPVRHQHRRPEQCFLGAIRSFARAQPVQNFLPGPHSEAAASENRATPTLAIRARTQK